MFLIFYDGNGRGYSPLEQKELVQVLRVNYYPNYSIPDQVQGHRHKHPNCKMMMSLVYRERFLLSQFQMLLSRILGILLR